MYSLFSSVRNPLRTYFPILCVAGLLHPSTASSQDEASLHHDDHEPPMEQVLISLPMRHQATDTLWPTEHLYGDALRRQVTSNLGDSLARLPGVASASFGPGVGRPVIRGQSGGRILVLQNSLSAADASTFSADHGVNVEPLLADGIEVLRGPSTLLYGGGAIGGVINVLDGRIPTRERDQISASLESRYRSVDDGKSALARVDASQNGWAWHVSTAHSENQNADVPKHVDDDGESIDSIDNSFGSARSVTVGGSRIGDAGYIGLSVETLRKRYGVPPASHEHEQEEEHSDVRLELEQFRYDFRAEFNPAQAWLETLRWYSRINDYEHVELEGSEQGTRWSRQGQDHRVEWVQHLSPSWHSVLGLQYGRETLRVDGEEAYLPAAGEADLGLFWLQDYQRERWHVELGVRFDRARRKQREDRSYYLYEDMSASLGGMVGLGSAWELGLALSRSARAPSIEELFSNDGEVFGDLVEHVATGAIEVGNRLLVSEVSNGADLSLNYRGDKLTLTSALYHNQFDDYIALRSTGLEQDELAVREYVQVGADFTGGEIAVAYSLNDIFTAKVFGDKVRASMGELGAVPRLPPSRIGVELEARYQSWFASIRFTDAAEQDRPGVGESSTEGYQRWDATLEWALPNSRDWRLFAQINNASDEEIRNATSFLRELAPEPGRSVELGLRLSL